MLCPAPYLGAVHKSHGYCDVIHTILLRSALFSFLFYFVLLLFVFSSLSYVSWVFSFPVICICHMDLSILSYIWQGFVLLFCSSFLSCSCMGFSILWILPFCYRTIYTVVQLCVERYTGINYEWDWDLTLPNTCL